MISHLPFDRHCLGVQSSVLDEEAHAVLLRFRPPFSLEFRQSPTSLCIRASDVAGFMDFLEDVREIRII
jgi:hypothetical protein